MTLAAEDQYPSITPVRRLVQRAAKPERRFGQLDRRGRFGRDNAILERGDVWISGEVARFGLSTYRTANLAELEVCKKGGELSLTWLVFALLSCLAAARAVLDSNPAMWAIAGALAILAIVAWQRRYSHLRYELLVRAGESKMAIYETTDQADAHLVHDALAMAIPAAA